MNNSRIINTQIYDCINNIIFSYDYNHKKDISEILTNIYNDLSNNIEDNSKYSQEPFVVKKMIKELKEMKEREIVLKYYKTVIQERLEQSTCFDKEFQESLEKAITKINTPENSL